MPGAQTCETIFSSSATSNFAPVEPGNKGPGPKPGFFSNLLKDSSSDRFSPMKKGLSLCQMRAASCKQVLSKSNSSSWLVILRRLRSLNRKCKRAFLAQRTGGPLSQCWCCKWIKGAQAVQEVRDLDLNLFSGT